MTAVDLGSVATVWQLVGEIKPGTRLCLQRDGEPVITVAEAGPVQGARFSVLVLDDPGLSQGLRTGDKVRLSVPRDGGLLRFDAHVYGGNGPYLVLTDLAPAIDRVARATERVPASARLACRIEGQARSSVVTLIDLSEGGLRCTAPAGAAVGSLVRVSDVDSPNGELAGMVVGFSKLDGQPTAHVALRTAQPLAPLLALAERLGV